MTDLYADGYADGGAYGYGPLFSREVGGPVETGTDRVRPGVGTFPEHWIDRSYPAGTAYSEKRKAWIIENIRLDEQRRNPYALLAAKEQRLHVLLRLAELERRLR